MVGVESPKQRRWAFPAENIGAIVIGVPVTFFLVIMATFASDAGPSTTSTVLGLLSFLVGPSIIVSVILSQAWRSQKWAYIGFFIPILVILLFIAYLFLDDYYINPRLGPLAQ